MLEPVGANASTGTATATLSEASPFVRFYAIHQAGTSTTSTIELLDTTGTTVLHQVMDVGETFREVVLSQTAGAPLIKSVRVTHTGGTGMIAIDDFDFSTDVQTVAGDDDGGSSGSSALGWIGLATLIAFLLGRVGVVRNRQPAPVNA